MKKKIGLCLSGCGMNDGSEIHESVITILALDSLNVDIVYMAPNITQKIVNNHLINNNSNETRNVLTESARISRGNILDIVDTAMIGQLGNKALAATGFASFLFFVSFAATTGIAGGI